MRQVLLNEITETFNKLKDLEKQAEALGVLRILSSGVHLELESFVKMFDEYIVNERDSDLFPWELVTEYNGVRFYAIFDAQEAEHYGIQIQK